MVAGMPPSRDNFDFTPVEWERIRVRIQENTRVDEHGCWVAQLAGWRSGHVPLRVGSKTNGTRSMPCGHRVAFQAWKGPIPEGLEVCHHCKDFGAPADNPACWNPDHLEAESQRVNVFRGSSPQAINARKTCCARGHKYTSRNTYVIRRSSGKVSRRCKRCQLDSQAQYRDRRR